MQRAAVLDLLAQLIAKSLVAVAKPQAATRYRLLETIRQYAHDKLLESGAEPVTRDRHLDFFLQYAETAEPHLERPEALDWFERRESDHANLRVALEWALARDAEKALRIAGALSLFWERRGHTSEGQQWLESALSHSKAEAADSEEQAHARTLARAKGLSALGPLTINQSDWPAGQAALAESERLWRALSDQRGLARVLLRQGLIATFQDDADEAQGKIEAGIALARASGDRTTLSQAHAIMARFMGRVARRSRSSENPCAGGHRAGARTGRHLARGQSADGIRHDCNVGG